MVVMFPEGIRGADGPQIYPGLYAVVGAAAYTGAVTHSLSIAVIVCETTGQLSPLLPVLVKIKKKTQENSRKILNHKFNGVVRFAAL